MNPKHTRFQEQLDEVRRSAASLLPWEINAWKQHDRFNNPAGAKAIARMVTNLRMGIADPRVGPKYRRYDPGVNKVLQMRAETTREAIRIVESDDILRAPAAWSFITRLTCVPPRLQEFACAMERDLKRMGGTWAKLQVNPAGLEHTQHMEITSVVRATLAHVSTQDPTQIAYYQSIKHLIADRQTRTTLGRFLNKFLGPNSKKPVLSDAEIKCLAERFKATAVTPDDIEFIENTDPDGWVRVYEDGPESCMQGADCVRVYARPGNGLRLAYLEDADGQVLARAIVREDTDPPQYVRVYPNPDDDHSMHTGFKAALETMGYVHGNLDGIKIALEYCDDGIVAPYIDSGRGGSQRARIDRDTRGPCLVLGSGPLSLTETSGYVEDDRIECDDCYELYDEEDVTYSSYLGRHICCDCQSNYTVAIANRYGDEDLVANDDVIYCESDGRYYAAVVAQEYDIYECAASGDWYHLDDLVLCDAGQYDGDYIHVDLAVQDHVTNEWGHRDEFTETADGWVFDDYLQTCCITGNERHEDYMVEVRNPKATLYFDPDAVTLDDLRQKFLVCGPVGGGGILVPRGYFGRELDESVYWYTPSNVHEGGRADVSFDDLVEGLVQDDLPLMPLPQTTAPQHHAHA